MFVSAAGILPSKLGDFMPGAAHEDRAAWAAVSGELRALVLRDAEQTSVRDWPVIKASDYRAFVENGDRAGFEDLYFTRRRMLNNLVLGELLEGEGRFLPGIIDGIFLICEESGWQLPAHNAYHRGGVRLAFPDTSRPVIDLFAAETAALLATAGNLLRKPLDAVSPEVTARIEREIATRIFTPYLGTHFWWMGRDSERMNNWTAWITQNVLVATFSLPTSQELRRNVLQKALGSLDAFLKDYAEDGACEEGVVYYRHAALCMHGAMTVIDTVAPDTMTALWRLPKIRNMAEYIFNMHVAGRHYFNFADSAAVIEPCTIREYLFGKAVGSEKLACFAVADRRTAVEPHIPGEWNLWYRVRELLAEPALAEAQSEGAGDIFYPGIGLAIARDGRFDLAVKAGNNGESHNHNDVGSITLYKDGQPFLIDIGVETYTARTFSAQRYEIWTMQSAWHNLPTFGGVMQGDGTGFAARDVAVDFSAEEARISLDIASAYPPEAGLRSYRRDIVLKRGHHVEIIDTHDGDRDAVLSLMTVAEPSISGGAIELAGLGRILIEGAGPIATEKIDITDARLRASWPAALYRIRVALAGRQLTLRIV